jgi:hypothetical protein
MNLNAQMKKLHWFGLFTGFRPIQNDFYEPRNEGYFFKRGASIAIGGWFESNQAKKYSFNMETFARKFIDFYDLLGIDFSLNQQYRINQKLSISYQLNLMPRFNSVGYAWSDESMVIFGKRRVKTIENILSAKYNFNNKMGITFRMRHYYSQ